MSLNTGERIDEPKGTVYTASTVTAEELHLLSSLPDKLVAPEPGKSWAAVDLDNFECTANYSDALCVQSSVSFIC
jgi:hypothetical protein